MIRNVKIEKDVLRQMQSGTSMVAQYILPKMLHFHFSQADGHLMLMTVLAERAMVEIENFVRNVLMKHKAYRQEIKRWANVLYAKANDDPKMRGKMTLMYPAPAGMTYVGYVKKWRIALDDVLITKEGDYRESLADIVDFIDECIADDCVRLRFAIQHELRQRKFANEELMTGLCMCIMYIDFYTSMVNVFMELSHGTLYALCNDPESDAAREKEIIYRKTLMQPVRMAVEEIFVLLLPKKTYFRLNMKEVEIGLNVVMKKLLSAEIVCSAAMKVGMDIRDEKTRDVKLADTPEEACRNAMTRNEKHDDAKKPQIRKNKSKKIDKDSLAKSLADKGWNVKREAI